MHCKAEFYYVGKIPRTGIGRPSKQRRVVLRRRNTVAGGKCAPPSALLVSIFLVQSPAIFTTLGEITDADSVMNPQQRSARHPNRNPDSNPG